MFVRRPLAALAAATLAGGVVVAVSVSGAASAGATPSPLPASGLAIGWGYNANGQVGTGTASTGGVSTPTPAALPAGVSAVQAAVGELHTLVLGSDGHVYAWGANTYGELGNGTNKASTTPVQVNLPAGVTPTAVAAGLEFSYALTADGSVYAWGYNAAGELGNQTTAPSSTPVKVSFPAGVTITQISAGYLHALALSSTGQVYAWGLNNQGQLGDNTVATRFKPVPITLPGSATAIQVSAGYGHSLALTSGGAVDAWGYNADGQLGNNSTTNSKAPVTIDLGGATATAVSAGYLHSLALTNVGAVLSWGDNTYGELGTGQGAGALPKSLTPVSVAMGGLTATQIGAGFGFSLFTPSTGGLKAFGDNTYGELGTGNNTSSSTPVSVKLQAGATVASIATEGYSLTAFVVQPLITTTTTVTSSLNPANPGQPTTFVATVTGVSGGTVAFTASGDPLPGCGSAPLRQVSGTTYRADCSDATLPVGNTTIQVYYAGDAYRTASSGTLSGGQTVNAVAGVDTDWGLDASGQLGDGATSARAVPVTPQLPADATVVSTVSDAVHTLALLSDGTVWAWGDNSDGELGDGTTNNSTVPVQVVLPGGVTPVSLAAGSYNSFVLTASGTVYAWGLNTSGQLGQGSTTNVPTPTPMNLPAGVVATEVSAGFAHTLVLSASGDVYSVGLNNFGQLGLGGTSTNTTPRLVTLPGGAKGSAVSAGYAHSLIVTDAGGVLTMGDNSQGELGVGSSTGFAVTPIAVPLPAGVTAVDGVASYFANTIRTSAGAVYAWGYNHYGELGNGSTTNSPSPVAVNLPAGVVATSIAAQLYTGMALGADGTVYTWGYGSDGELGNGGRASSSTPVTVKLPAGGSALAIYAGGDGATGTAIVGRIATVTSVVSSPNPSIYGQTVTITAGVAPNDGGGTLSFASDGNPIAGCTNLNLAVKSGVYFITCKTSVLEVGNHTITASYSGDRLYQPSVGTLTGGQNVSTIPTTTAVATSLTPGHFGTAVTFTATVTGSDAGGSVAFLANGSGITGCDSQPLTAGTGNTATATCTTSGLPVGSNAIEADYSGDAHYAPSSGTLAGGETIKYDTTLTAAPVKVLNVLQHATYTATLVNSVDGSPVVGATVAFHADASGDALQCTAVTDSTGTATCKGQSPVTLGTFRAVYDGDDTHFGDTDYSSISL